MLFMTEDLHRKGTVAQMHLAPVFVTDREHYQLSHELSSATLSIRICPHFIIRMPLARVHDPPPQLAGRSHDPPVSHT